MALDFSASTDKVVYGSGSSLDDLQTLTTVSWFSTDVTATAQRVWTKGYPAADSTYHYFLLDTSDRLVLEYDRITADQSAIALLSNFSTWPGTGAWVFAAGVSDPSTDGNNKLYIGTPTALAVEPSAYAVQRAGTDGFRSDAAVALTVGQRGGDVATFNGRIAFVGIWNRQLTQQEIWAQQMCPTPTNGCVLFTYVGLTGTGAQPDWSGNGNTGTVTGTSVAANPPLLAPFRGFHFDEGDEYAIAAAGSMIPVKYHHYRTLWANG